MTKILLLGLPGAGKTSILSKTYIEINTQSENTFQKQILKIKSLEKILNLDIVENDIGDSLLSGISSEDIKKLFHNAGIIIWVVDISDQRTLYSSSFHYNTLVETSRKYFPFIKKIICFNKIDLLSLESIDRKSFYNSIMKDFGCESDSDCYFTTITDDSSFKMMADILKNIQQASFEMKQIENKIYEFLQTNEDFYGIIILSSEGLPVLEKGDKTELVILPANLWLGTNERLKEAFNTHQLSCTIHLHEQILIFFDIGNDLLLTAIAKEEAPLQFSYIRSDMLAQSLRNILGYQ